MLVRKAVITDAQGIAEVHVASKKAAFRGLTTESALNSLSVADRKEKWRVIISERKYDTLIAGDSNTVLGFINYGPTRDTDSDGKVGEILALYVHPDVWRGGFGKELVSNALSQLKADGFTSVTLWTLETSNQARKFYESCGFVFDGNTKKSTLPGDVIVNDVRYRIRL